MGATEGEWLAGLLGGTSSEVLHEVVVQVALHRQMSLYDLITAWHLHVRKMQDDCASSERDPGVWGAHDLLAALSIRDLVDRGAGELDAALSEEVASAVGRVDAEFLSFTERDDSGLVQLIDDSTTVGTGWWWRRVPAEGPIRRELDAIANHAAG